MTWNPRPAARFGLLGAVEREPVVHDEKRSRFLHDLLEQAILGAHLGLLCAVGAVVLNAGHLRGWLYAPPSPCLHFALLVIGLSLLFAIGIGDDMARRDRARGPSARFGSPAVIKRGAAYPPHSANPRCT